MNATTNPDDTIHALPNHDEIRTTNENTPGMIVIEAKIDTIGETVPLIEITTGGIATTIVTVDGEAHPHAATEEPRTDTERTDIEILIVVGITMITTTRKAPVIDAGIAEAYLLLPRWQTPMNLPQAVVTILS